jgi:16S rRNA (guanine527-N7)-methyltransferase
MVSADIIFQYFPNFNDKQVEQIEILHELYQYHNSRVNVISRKDIENFYVHHVLHSLSLFELASFDRVESVIDIGTGGGFPGIPLAIALPKIQFHLVDSIGKKIQVVKTVADDIGLVNVRATHARAEQINEKFDMAVSRAVAPAKDMIDWMQGKWRNKPYMAFLKGGDLSLEMNEALELNPRLKIKSKSIFDRIPEPFFETKKVLLLN